jgi:hypothetical protein
MACLHTVVWREKIMPDWSMKELQEWDDKICAFGEKP